MLEEIRFEIKLYTTQTKLIERATNYNNNQILNSLLITTHIVGYCETSKQINNTICNILPVNDDKYLIAKAIDFWKKNKFHLSLSKQNLNQKQICH